MSTPEPTVSPNAGFYRDVLLCCAPLLAMSYVLYGPRPVVLAAISCAMAYVMDRLLAPLHGKDYDSGELSSECFAVLLTLLMPANASAYVLAFAVIAAVVIKEVFGGAGHYPFNPAAVGYAMVAVAWPDEVFRYPAVGIIPITGTGSLTLYESASATLRAGGLPNLSNTQLLVGNYAGPMGTGFTLILISLGVLLAVRRRISPYTVGPFLFGCALVAWLLPRTGNLEGLSLPWEHLPERLTSLKFEMLSGAVIFAAVFLICEPVTQPKTGGSRVAYGLLLGVLTMMFRYYGVYETGVCFAVLILNALSNRLDIVVEWIAGRRASPLEPAQPAVPARQPAAPAYRPRAAASLSDTQYLETMPLDAAMMTPMTQAISKEAVREALERSAAEPEREEEASAGPQPSAPRKRRQRFAETAKTLMIPVIKDPEALRKELQNGNKPRQ